MNPGMKHELRLAGEVLRQLALDYDESIQRLEEQGFQDWQRDTVYPAAVNRHIEEACHE